MARMILRVVCVIAIGFFAGGMVLAAEETVATVDGEPIFRADLDKEARQILNSSYFHKTLTDEKNVQLKSDALERLIKRQLNIFGGLDRGMQLPLKKASEMRAQIEGQLGSEAYRKSISERGWTSAQHLNVIARTLLGQDAYQRFVVEASVVLESELVGLYEADQSRWRMPESQHLRRLLLKVGADDPAAVAMRMEEARALKKLAEEGSDFEGLAIKHSEGPYRIKGGDLGWVHRGVLAGQAEELVWGAKQGSLVGPILTEDGVLLFHVIERREARQLKFKEAEPTLRKETAEKRRIQVEAAWFGAIRSKHTVKILDPSLRFE